MPSLPGSSADRDVGELVCAPGNPGIARIARTIPCDISNPDAVLDLADREQIDFTVVGPELPLSVGVADRFAAAGRLLLGPDRRRGTPRVEQGIRESVHGAARRADRPLPYVGNARRCAARRSIAGNSDGRLF